MKKHLMTPCIAQRLDLKGWTLAILLLFAAWRTSAQAVDYGNGWYDSGVNYWRLMVSDNGIHRVSAAQLVQAGFDTSGIDPAHLHLICRGEEQHIHVEPGSSGGWEFIEFFGRQNDAGLDTLMYRKVSSMQMSGSIHPNPLHSTFADTSCYFLYADQLAGLRLTTPFLGMVPPPQVIQEVVRTSVFEYAPGDLPLLYSTGPIYDLFTSMNPEWTDGEGYAGEVFIDGIPLTVKVPAPQQTNSGPATIRLRIFDQSAGAQEVRISIDGQLLGSYLTTQSGISDHVLTIPFPIGDTVTVQCETVAQPGSGVHFLNLVTLSYPGTTDLEGGTSLNFPDDNGTQVYYQFHHVAPGNLGLIYDLSHHLRYADTIHGDSVGIWVAGQGNTSAMHFSTDGGVLSPVILPPFSTDISNTSQAADMVVITSRELSASAQAYRNYRQGSQVNPLQVRVVHTDEIYQEFSHGTPHPLAIQRFCNYALDHWAVPPSQFLIWGRGMTDIREDHPASVPAYGTPMSDWLYLTTLRRDTTDYQTRASIGRVPIQTDQQGMDYISKISIYETTGQAPWMRNGIFVTHGHASDSAMLRVLDGVMDTVTRQFRTGLGVGRDLRYGYQDSALVDSAAVSQNSALQQGASLMMMFGVNATLMGLQDPTGIGNEGRYPVLVGISCRYFPQNRDTLTVPEKWVVAQSEGAIAVLGHSAAPFVIPAELWSFEWMRTAYHEQFGSRLGDLTRITADSLVEQYPDMAYRNQVLCMNIMGDPSIHLRNGAFQVWPGDANDDLVANAQDLLNIGLAYGDTGAVRPNASLQWMGQTAGLWDSTFSNGTNHVHADCNGDGIVNAADTTAIQLNYGLTHAKTHGLLTGTDSDPELSIESSGGLLANGSVVQLTVRLGTPQQPADSVYGIAWSIHYDPNLVDSASVVVDFDSCWLGQVGQNLLTLSRHLHQLGRIDMAITRTDHQPISGEGVISRIGIVVIDNISGKMPGDTMITTLPVFPSDAMMIDPNAQPLPLRGHGTDLRLFSVLAEPELQPGQQVGLFPNPTRDEVYIQTADEGAATIELYDLGGRKLMARSYPAGAPKRIDLSAYQGSVYVLKVSNAAGEFHVRICKTE
ncbi:MAG: C25 family cysteine peptidase [Bacteroidia bacterium]